MNLPTLDRTLEVTAGIGACVSLLMIFIGFTAVTIGRRSSRVQSMARWGMMYLAVTLVIASGSLALGTFTQSMIAQGDITHAARVIFIAFTVLGLVGIRIGIIGSRKQAMKAKRKSLSSKAVVPPSE